MKRRQLIQYAGSGFVATVGMGVLGSFQGAIAQTGGVTIQNLGHTCFLFTGGGRRVLVNPFRQIGCTKGYRPSQVAADLVMISSRLFDEGFVDGLPGSPRILDEPGVYDFSQAPAMQVQGISSDHDDVGGKRFGRNVIWKWNQGGLNLVHMGGAAAPITIEQQTLMGRPDVLLIPVGNGPKAYTPEEAKATVQALNPRIVIPTHFRTQAADTAACDILPLDNFLQLMQGTTIERAGASVSVSSGDLPGSTKIVALSYAF